MATKWLIRVNNIKSSALEVKKHRNAFLSYLIEVLIDQVRSEYPEFEAETDSEDINEQGYPVNTMYATHFSGLQILTYFCNARMNFQGFP